MCKATFESLIPHNEKCLTVSAVIVVPQCFAALLCCMWQCQSLKSVTGCQAVRKLSGYTRAKAGYCGSQNYIL